MWSFLFPLRIAHASLQQLQCYKLHIPLYKLKSELFTTFTFTQTLNTKRHQTVYSVEYTLIFKYLIGRPHKWISIYSINYILDLYIFLILCIQLRTIYLRRQNLKLGITFTSDLTAFQLTWSEKVEFQDGDTILFVTILTNIIFSWTFHMQTSFLI